MTSTSRDSRTGTRVLSTFPGRIELFNRQATYSCVIKDYSPDGARISIDNALLIPNAFMLEVPAKGFRKRVEVKWREDFEIGVNFSQDDNQELLLRIGALESEMRSLSEQLQAFMAAQKPAET